jgi:hypothetical protein
LTSNFPAPLTVPSRKTSKKRGQQSEPLIKHHRGVSIAEKEDMLAATNCSREIHDHFEKHHLGIGALPVFCGSCSLSKDWVESKERWTEHPNLFQVQVKLKFGKPGATSLKRCKHKVASDFEN